LVVNERSIQVCSEQRHGWKVISDQFLQLPCQHKVCSALTFFFKRENTREERYIQSFSVWIEIHLSFSNGFSFEEMWLYFVSKTSGLCIVLYCCCWCCCCCCCWKNKAQSHNWLLILCHYLHISIEEKQIFFLVESPIHWIILAV